MLKLKTTSKFRSDLKVIKKRGLDLSPLEFVITELQQGNKLPFNCRDHELHGNYKGFRECHIQPDWLLIYRIDEIYLTLTVSRTGTHSDLFF